MTDQLSGTKNPIIGESIAENSVTRVLEKDVVISGLSGRLPESSNIEEFKKNLFEGIDMVTENERRWSSNLFGLPARSGTLKDITSFDATFFGVHAKQAHSMDPQIRMLLEATYEAIVDSGINPVSIRGTRTGVFIGVSNPDSGQYWTKDANTVTRYTSSGCNQTMFSNRISYAFDFTGPSYALDTACSSSLYAMNHAIMAIRNGECDAAIVGGVNLLLQPTASLQFQRTNMLSLDGKCRSFDADGQGYARAESVVVLFLQKSMDARRVYATVIETKTNADGYKPEGITYPNGEMQYNLMREVYDETGIDPLDISYFEAHATGTDVGDSQEVNSIAKLFCKGRKGPLLIGSIKSNMGHPEPASALCAIAKVLLAMESGMLPPNLHYQTPNPNIPALLDGRLKVVTELTPWNGGLVALNSFSFGGTNGHLLLRSNPKPKLSSMLETKLPKLVTASGRTTEAVNCLLDAARQHERDDEFIALLRNIHCKNIPGHQTRGFEILGNSNSREVSVYSGSKRPIWFVFSGMGSQWEGMGRELLCIENFRLSLERCAKALKPEGVDLMDLLLNGTTEMYDDTVNCFVSIAAIQVALVDLLTLLGIHPDGIVGHSAGELGCAYADGSLTDEQMVLSAYWRGKCVQETDIEPGAMAAVGLSYEEAQNRCPPGIYPVCHNSADSVTISGPIEATNMFVKELQSQGVFARLVNSTGYAFHSKYVAPAGPKLFAALEKVIPNPKKRSPRWISSSVPECSWDDPLAQYGSAAYMVNNLVSPVLFHKATAHIPEDAIAIEIAPHCLFQAVLRKSLSPNVTNIGLQKRDHADNIGFLLSNIGKLYAAGAQPNISALYPPVSRPVSRGTPMISPYIKWDHSVKWTVPNFSYMSQPADNYIEVDLTNPTDEYLIGHVIDGRTIFPATGYIVLVWKHFAQLNSMDYESMPVIIENVRFQRATIIPKEGPVKFIINIFTGNGDFEIWEGGSVTVTGRIRRSENIDKEQLDLPPHTLAKKSEVVELNKDDISKELRLRGYYCSGAFQAIKKAHISGITGELIWRNNWVPFMDAMLQMSIFANNCRGLYLPTRLQYVAINPVLHLKIASTLSQENAIFPISCYKNHNCVKSGGVEMRGLKVSFVPRRQATLSAPKLERYTFIPYENKQILDKDPCVAKLHALCILLEIVCENILSSKLKIVEVADKQTPEALLMTSVLDILYSEPIISIVDAQIVTASPDDYIDAFDQSTIKVVHHDIRKAPAGNNLHVVIAANVLTGKCLDILKNLSSALKNGGFIILEENDTCDPKLLKDTDLTYVSAQISYGKTYVLLKKIEPSKKPTVIEITEKSFSWLDNFKSCMKKGDQDIMFMSQGEELCGMVGFMNCLRIESGGANTRYVFIQDKNAPKFSLSSSFYANQMRKQVIANVLKGGQWGSYRHLRLEPKMNVPTHQSKHAFINTLTRGDLSSLRWIESPLKFQESEIHPDRKTCTVYCASLNFKDIMLATGKLSPDALPENVDPQDCILGIEYAGRDTRGRRVMGMVSAKGLATTVVADELFTWEVPDEWTLEEAATVPVAYSTCYYALIMRGRLQPNDAILIHVGSGAVGQASIRIALHLGCNIFTTVGSQEKRQYLKKLFPQLTDRNIGNSRDTSFEQLIMNETKGRGVDVIVNSLAEDKLQATVRCLAVGGRFLEIGKYDLANNSLLDASLLVNETFHGIIVDSFFGIDTPEKRVLVRLLYEGIKNGVVRPLQTTVFSTEQIEQAFRYMATGKHIGKVVLKIRDEEPQKIVQQPSLKSVAAIPRTYMNPGKSYVLVGGLGGFGLELADWMICRGAKHIVLVSRSGIRTGYQAFCVKRWREHGIKVVISDADSTTLAGAEQLINESNKLAPIGGIFNLAVVLNDALIENLDEQNFKTVALPKIDATKNLDTISRKNCPSLDYFVVFSSLACGRGNIGQTNYGFANSAMERIVEQRQLNGLPGLAIQWGAVGDVGLFVETVGDNDTEVAGTLPQRISSCLLTMDTLLQQTYPVVASLVLADKGKTDQSSNDVSLLDTVSNILGIKDSSTVNLNSTLSDLGMDSLMGTEIKQTLERNYDLVLSPQEIRGLTLNNLLEMSSGNSSTGDVSIPKRKNNSKETITNDLLCQFADAELLPKQSFVELQTKNSSGSPLFLIHAIEGLLLPFEALARELERPAWGFQCIEETPFNDLTETAKVYIEQMKQIQKQGPYHIAGYSFGTSIAFEMGLQLEKAGEEVKLTFIDGSPKFVTWQTYAIKSATGEGSLLDSYKKNLAFFVTLFRRDINFNQAHTILKVEMTEEQALNKMVELIGHAKFKPEELKLTAVLMFKRILAGHNYKPSMKFNGKVVLVKAVDSFAPLKHDYDLSEICKQNVEVIEIAGDHRSILLGDSVKKIASLLRI